MKLYTNISELSFFHGHKIDIDINQNYEEIESKIRELINNLMPPNLPNNFEIQIFLSGGIPLFPKFGSHAQNINDFNQRIYPIRNKIYAIITKKLGSEINKEILEPCSLAHQNLLSPICKSTTAGLTQIASFLGYVYHQGIYSEKLLLILEKTTRFGPLLVNFLRLMKRLPLTGLNIISITAPLCLFFKSILPFRFEYEKVFEYTFKILTFIHLIQEIDCLFFDEYDIDTNKYDDEEDGNEEKRRIIQYLRRSKQQKKVLIWNNDIKYTNFTGFNIDKPNDDVLTGENNVHNCLNTFKDINPLSLKKCHYSSFVKGRRTNEAFLFIGKVANKDNYARYIDPYEGEVKEASIEELSKIYQNAETQNIFSIVDKELIHQVIIFCLDESSEMNQKVNSKTRFEIASQFLQSFINRIERRSDTLYGMISFKKDIEVIQEIDREKENIFRHLTCDAKIEGERDVFAALTKAFDMIYAAKFNEDQNDDDAEEIQFENAKYRIVLISSEPFDHSKFSENLLSENLDDIVIDSVNIGDSPADKGLLFSLTDITNGLYFQPSSDLDCQKIIEKEVFIDIEMRNNSKDLYTSKSIVDAKSYLQLASPKYMRKLFEKERQIETFQCWRILDELNEIESNPNENCVVYSSLRYPGKWRIFIKNPVSSKWLNCFMSVTKFYPIDPPKFVFLTVPFHPNISDEGILRFGLIDEEYRYNLKIYSILDSIINLLENPDEKYYNNFEALQLFKNDKSGFENIQREREIGIEDYKDFLKDAKVFDEIPDYL